MKRFFAWIGAAWLLASGAAAAQTGVVECRRNFPDHTYMLCHEAIIPAPVAEVWAAWSTTQGLSAWVAPLAAIDLRPGGLWESSYAPGARLGDPANIQNRVLAYAPERMLAIQIARTPPGFPEADLARRLWTIIDLEPLDSQSTRVRVSMLGYGQGAGFQTLAGHFNAGNAYTLQKLQERFTQGPVDWSRVRAPATPGEAR